MQLRPYQQRCVDKSLAYMRKTLQPGIIDAAPAAGKSHMIAAIAHKIYNTTGKRILCLAPSAQLVNQNHQKYLLTGNPASKFSASAGCKELRHPVVFGTPQTVLNKIDAFQDYALVVLDESHYIPPTVQKIIESMRASNPNLRVLGFSGTPYRLGQGYIFAEHADGTMNGEDTAKDPYFYKCIERVTAQEMLDGGFITPMEIGINEGYDTSKLVVDKGQFTQDSIHKTFEGKGRLTADIVADVVKTAQHIPGGCMFFAASINHGLEIMESLPPAHSGFVTGDDKKMVQPYRDGKIKYIVSVGTLTTGFDVDHTSVIATLRQTMSAALLQQILGRAWRIHPDKPVSYWLDYAGNYEQHFPDGDIYTPEIKAKKDKESEDKTVKAECPLCSYHNEFKYDHEKADGYEIDKNGYCIDLNGLRIESDYGPIPAHHGRRCFGFVPGSTDRCTYRWTYKECEECGAKNDIAARVCYSCKSEIVDPNEKLTRDFERQKKNPYTISTDKVITWTVNNSVSSKGNGMYVVHYVTEYRKIKMYYVHSKPNRTYNAWSKHTQDGKIMPKTITYYKNRASGFWEIVDYNRQED